MAKISKDFSVGPLHPRENLIVTGNLGALNAEIVIDCDGASGVTFDLRGTFVLTATLEGTTDGANWIALPFRALSAPQYAVAATTAGTYAAPCAGFERVRLRASAYTSGTANGVLVASMSSSEGISIPAPAPLSVTNTGAASAAVTLTIPAVAGMYHYITGITIVRFASALLTAGATPVLVTTTNMNGARVWSLPADAAAQGTNYNIREEYSTPLRSSATNTPTTIVCPVTTGVIWRVTADYFLYA